MARHRPAVSTAGERGRSADRPSEIPKSGWRDILLRVKEDVTRDNVSLVAAGLALYALLAIFPAMGAAVAVYGLFASPQDIARHVAEIMKMLPPEAARIVEMQLQDLASRQGRTLGFGAAVGVLLALWSARKGMAALMVAANIAYQEREERGFIRRALISLGFTIVAVAGFLFVIAMLVAVPVALEMLPVGPAAGALLAGLRWILLWLVAVLGLAVVYRYGPDRDKPRWRWVTWGSGIAATLWLIGSALFAVYVSNFGSYNETYGALGGVIVLLLWFYLTGFIIILGAEINAEMERQTTRDTTTGPREPMGRRGAYAADTLGRTPR